VRILAAMSFFALVLILIASFTHAFWNFLAKKSKGGVAFIWLTYCASSIIFLPVMVAQYFNTPFSLSITIIVVAIVSALLRLGYFLLLQRGYQKSDLSVVYPLARGSAPLFSTLGAVVVLAEQPTLNSFVGLIFIIAGVLVITNLKFRSDDSKVNLGVAFGIGTGCMIGLYTLWDKEAIVHYHLSPLLITYASHIIGAAILAPLAFREKEKIREEIKFHRWYILGISVLSPVSYLLVLEAMKTTPVIYIGPARELSIVFGVFMGSRLMDEKHVRRRLLASLIILIGIVFLALG
jgi:drug/metabolite transporter (DMT)-like permease